MEFKAVPRTIADTLDLKRKYVIPRFQREYSWENDELQELWDDLLDCFTVNNGKLYPNEYFIGTLVLVGDDNNYCIFCHKKIISYGKRRNFSK